MDAAEAAAEEALDAADEALDAAEERLEAIDDADDATAVPVLAGAVEITEPLAQLSALVG